MAISDENATVYATVTREMKEYLQGLAKRNHRTLSGEVAYALMLYRQSQQDKEVDSPKAGDEQAS